MAATEKPMINVRLPECRILYFAPCGLEEGVGGGARLRNMVSALGQLGAGIQLISYLPAGGFSVVRRQVSRRLKTTTVSVRRRSPKILKILALGLVLIYGLGHIRRSNLVLAHAPGIVSGFPALILAKLFRKPLLIDHMDVNDPDTPGFTYRLVLKNAALVFTISRYLEAEARGIGCRNVVYLPVFVDANVFHRDIVERRKSRESLRISDGDIIIGYAGSFWAVEGLPVLLRAFKKLHARHENIKLVLVGGGNVPGSDDVPRLIRELAVSDRVIIVPPQPHELMPEYLSAFDIACSPKIDCAENRAANPIKIYEYMAMGLPMVSSAVGEAARIIENGVDGFLVKPGDEDDLAGALEYIIQNLDSAREIGQRAREKLVRNYSQPAVLKTIAEAIKTV